MLAIHLNSRITPAVLYEIAQFREPTGALAGRYGIGTQTIHKR